MGHSGRDDRRRRLLAEDPTAATGEPGDAATLERGRQTKHKSENYGDAEFLQKQARLTDMVPRRLLSSILLLKVGIAVICGLVALYITTPRLLHTPDARPAAAILGGPGSLSNWFASLLLLAAGFLAVVNYTVRKHKMDDYRGRYRVWLWAAACWFLMATDVAASLHQAFQQTMITLTHTPIVGDGTIWWLAPAIVLVGATGTWLLIDMRSCRLASTALVLAAIAYGVALVAFLHGVRMPSELASLLLLQVSLLAGHLLAGLVNASRPCPLRAHGRRRPLAAADGETESQAATHRAAQGQGRHGQVGRGLEGRR